MDTCIINAKAIIKSKRSCHHDSLELVNFYIKEKVTILPAFVLTYLNSSSGGVEKHQFGLYACI